MTISITTMAELCAGDVLLIDGAIRVIIRRVAINKAIKKECVERKPPVRRRRRERVVIPLAPVVEGLVRGRTLVEVVLDVLRIVAERASEPDTEGQEEERKTEAVHIFGINE